MECAGGIFVFLFLCQIHSMIIKGSATSVVTREMTIGITRNLCFFFGNWNEHVGRCRSFMPPQSLQFLSTEIAVIFAKIPKFGTSPDKLLNERLR